MGFAQFVAEFHQRCCGIQRFDHRADLAANKSLHGKIGQQSHDIQHQRSVVMRLFHHGNTQQLQPKFGPFGQPKRL